MDQAKVHAALQKCLSPNLIEQYVGQLQHEMIRCCIIAFTKVKTTCAHRNLKQIRDSNITFIFAVLSSHYNLIEHNVETYLTKEFYRFIRDAEALADKTILAFVDVHIKSNRNFDTRLFKFCNLLCGSLIGRLSAQNRISSHRLHLLYKKGT